MYRNGADSCRLRAEKNQLLPYASAEQSRYHAAEHDISVIVVDNDTLADLGIARSGDKDNICDHSIAYMLMNIDMRLDSLGSADLDRQMTEVHCAAARGIGRFAALKYKSRKPERADRAGGHRYSVGRCIRMYGVRLGILRELSGSELSERQNELCNRLGGQQSELCALIGGYVDRYCDAGGLRRA